MITRKLFHTLRPFRLKLREKLSTFKSRSVCRQSWTIINIQFSTTTLVTSSVFSFVIINLIKYINFDSLFDKWHKNTRIEVWLHLSIMISSKIVCQIRYNFLVIFLPLNCTSYKKHFSILILTKFKYFYNSILLCPNLKCMLYFEDNLNMSKNIITLLFKLCTMSLSSSSDIQ